MPIQAQNTFAIPAEYGLLLGISQRSKLPFPAPYENIQRTKLRLDEYQEQ
ncbi:hypothetical protein PPACK8108_LOCUS3880 [Phakopsora pachyrhizi]|uniref:Uncharacterized protein n=1 Tax=Phakopsora pachyrhizi TaxID=170000 RepID=A0AAV0ALE3_PHAPC|nr:hypothetical protein PPACK8108_LOCUS3880 [Phakopsora pachyrhizi]